jgi:hypothetical protein
MILEIVLISLWIIVGVLTFLSIKRDRKIISIEDKGSYNYVVTQFALVYSMLMMELILNMIIK